LIPRSRTRGYSSWISDGEAFRTAVVLINEGRTLACKVPESFQPATYSLQVRSRMGAKDLRQSSLSESS
jgi:hypothetical protein